MSELVFKILPASTTFHAVNYNDNKEKKGVAKMVHFRNFGALGIGGVLPDEKEVVKYLESYSSTNSRTKHKQFHAVMSCKGKMFSHEELKDKALFMMEELGYKDQPMLIYGHSDTDNNHVHIVTTRIDKNGNKISDSFEKKRSSEILKKMLDRNINKELQADLQKCFGYKFSTEAQFRLLMENLGYKITTENEKLQFIKYASVQGEISKEDIFQRLQNENDSNRIYQIRAIIKKYQQQFDIQLKCSTPYSDNPKLESELSRFLKSNLGVECVFFAKKGTQEAHGYTIIDHATKTVFKGSDVMKLAEFITPATRQLSSETSNIFQNKEYPPEETYNTSQTIEEDNFSSTGIGEALSTIIYESEKQDHRGISGNEREPDKRRRRFF